MNQPNESISGSPVGKTTIAPGVLVTIARLTSLSIPGVARMAAVPGGVNRIFRRGTGEGVRIEIENGNVSVDLFVILEQDAIVLDVCRNMQAAVARAIEDMVGMEAKRIDVHVEEIDYSTAEAKAQ